jgi:hypothetical protein
VEPPCPPSYDAAPDGDRSARRTTASSPRRSVTHAPLSTPASLDDADGSATAAGHAADEREPERGDGGGGGGGAHGGSRRQRLTFMQRVEAYCSRLATKNQFFHRIFSLIYLPFAYRSGISMKKDGTSRFVAVLPFTRFNRNWYNAMAGAALLGNSEVAGGMYLFAKCGGEYTVVCKQMNYRFLRPCFGPAIYEVVQSENIDEKLKAGGEFNIDLEMEVRQQLRSRGREMLVGKCHITFHCTPKAMARARRERKRNKPAALPAADTKRS